MTTVIKPPIGAMILLHVPPGDETAPCMYCGKEQPWEPMEPCEGPIPLREDRALLNWLDEHPTGGVMKTASPVDAAGGQVCELVTNTWVLEGRTIREAIRNLRAAEDIDND